MNILCIDIGGGTQDICCYNGKDTFENSFKMVIPTPAKRMSQQIESLNKDIFINGTIIGGGTGRILKKKISEGYNVFISKKAAPSIKDNLEKVAKSGFTIVEEVLNPDITFNEFDHNIIIPAANSALNGFEPDIIAAAVQDHGYIKNQSDRVTRFNFLKDIIKNGLENAFFDDFSKIPDHMTRFRSIYKSIEEIYPDKKIIVTDTALVACLGACLEADTSKPFITIDIGNCHTFAIALNEKKETIGFFEHHTGSLTKELLEKYINELAKGSISHDEIFMEDGHGAFLAQNQDISGCPVYLTGPNRNRFFSKGKTSFIFADPKGDTMMTGPIGMLIQQGIKL